MDEARLVRVSKYLSKHLRHAPERLGLALSPGGWVEVEALLAACARDRSPISRDELEEVVACDDKRRFAFDPTGSLIRANQGHSVAVDLQLEAVPPPEVLFHGTGVRWADAIAAEGLRKMRRHHVHLSPDPETARRVGARHGRPVIFVVRAGEMHRAGVPFYQSDNGVWFVDHVPPEYLERI